MTPTRLMYSKANQAFVFTFGDQLLRMGDNPMFYRRKPDALRAALNQGLLVDKSGYVFTLEEHPQDSSVPRRSPTRAQRMGHGDWSSDLDGAGLSELEGRATLRTRVGTRVRFVPNPGSFQLYSNPPEDGEEGEVTTVAHVGGRRSSMRGPGGGLLYIAWDRTGPQGVSPSDVEVVSGRKGRALAGLDGARKVNQRDYKFYVIVYPPSGPLIESGWEYRDDAKDQTAEGNMYRSSPDMQFKILTKTGAKREGIDPDDNANWAQGEWWKESNYDAAVRRGVLKESNYDAAVRRGVLEGADWALELRAALTAERVAPSGRVYKAFKKGKNLYVTIDGEDEELGSDPDDIGSTLYSLTQTSDSVKSGDQFEIPLADGTAVVILDKAWPVQLSGPRLPEMHNYRKYVGFSKLEPGDRYDDDRNVYSIRPGVTGQVTPESLASRRTNKFGTRDFEGRDWRIEDDGKVTLAKFATRSLFVKWQGSSVVLRLYGVEAAFDPEDFRIVDGE